MSKIKKILISTIFSLIMISGYSVVNAASASISSNKTSMSVGETASITVSAKAASWNLEVSGPISKSYADVTSDGENAKKSFSLSFKPSKVGTYTIKLGGDVTDGDGTTNKISDSVTIKVSEAKESSVTTLKNLGITPKQYDFSNFKSGTTSYNIKVPSDVDTIKIYATATDKNATVSGTGSKKLEEGKNTFTVKVTAEDKKNTKKYTLVITRESSETETSTENRDEEEKAVTEGLTDLIINNYNLEPQFSNDVYEYKVNINSDVSKLDLDAKPANDNMKVEIVGNEDLKDGENVITILVYNSSDDTTTTYQIIANKGETAGIDLSEMNNAIEQAKKTQLKFNCILGATVGSIIILIIIFLIEKYRIQKKQEDDVENISTLDFEEQNLDENNDEVIKNRTKGKRFK